MPPTRPDNLNAEQGELLANLTAACPEMTQLAQSIADFAPLLAPHADNADALTGWIAKIRAADLPHLHAFTRGLERDLDAVIAGLTLPYSNGPTEGVNTKTKRIARQMHGRAGFTLLRHRILLGQRHPLSPPNVSQGRRLDTPPAWRSARRQVEQGLPMENFGHAPDRGERWRESPGDAGLLP